MMGDREIRKGPKPVAWSTTPVENSITDDDSDVEFLETTTLSQPTRAGSQIGSSSLSDFHRYITRCMVCTKPISQEEKREGKKTLNKRNELVKNLSTQLKLKMKVGIDNECDQKKYPFCDKCESQAMNVSAQCENMMSAQKSMNNSLDVLLERPKESVRWYKSNVLQISNQAEAVIFKDLRNAMLEVYGNRNIKTEPLDNAVPGPSSSKSIENFKEKVEEQSNRVTSFSMEETAAQPNERTVEPVEDMVSIPVPKTNVGTTGDERATNDTETMLSDVLDEFLAENASVEVIQASVNGIAGNPVPNVEANRASEPETPDSDDDDDDDLFRAKRKKYFDWGYIFTYKDSDKKYFLCNACDYELFRRQTDDSDKDKLYYKYLQKHFEKYHQPTVKLCRETPVNQEKCLPMLSNCKVCEKKFPTKHSLTVHTKTHNGDHNANIDDSSAKSSPRGTKSAKENSPKNQMETRSRKRKANMVNNKNEPKLATKSSKIR